MKGVIAIAFRDTIINQFGKDKWTAILTNAGIDKELSLLATTDVKDDVVMGLIKSACSVLNINLSQAADVFGEYWVNTYAPKVYRAHYKNVKNAREFLLKMDLVHQITTNTIANAKPPRFDYEWKDDKTLIMTYKSPRGLIDLFIGLIKGVGKYYKENLTVSKLTENKVEVVFS